MSELPSAIFLIADGNEFRFARFYIVCEEVPLGTPESPLIVCGLSDTLRECPNVAKPRNGMPATAWKKYVNFASKICRRLFILELFCSLVFLYYKHVDTLCMYPHAYFYYNKRRIRLVRWDIAPVF